MHPFCHRPVNIRLALQLSLQTCIRLLYNIMASATDSKLTQDILHGDMWSLLRRFSLPAIIGMSINGINAFFDGLLVGQYVGEAAVAAISLAFPLTFITAGLSAAIGVGGSSLLSQAIGADEEDTQRSMLGTTAGLSFIASILLMSICIPLADEMIGFLGGTGEIQRLGALYYRITLFGAFFRIHGVAVNMLIRAEGKVNIAMYMSMATAISNILLNILFMGYMDMGIAGAAWATVISMILFTVMGYTYYGLNKANYTVDTWSINLKSPYIKTLLGIGVSAAMLQIMFFLQQSVVFLLIKKYGTDWDIALMGTSIRVLILMLFPSFGFAIAYQPIAGINFGAKNIDRVGDGFKKFVYTATATILIPYVLVMIYPEVVIGWMLPDTALSATDVFNFRMMISTIWILPSFFMGTTLFQATGEARWAAMLTISRDLLIFIPCSILLPLWFDVAGLYYARIPTNLIMIVIVVFIVNRQFRKWRARMS